MRIYSAFLNKKTKMNDGIIKIIDFERLMYALRDFELDILYRMIRKPWKFQVKKQNNLLILSLCKYNVIYRKILSRINPH